MGYYERFFSKTDYRVLIAIAPVLGLLLLPFALNIPLGIDFTGGTEIQILTQKDLSKQAVESEMSQCAGDAKANVQSLGDMTSIIVRSKSEIQQNCLDLALDDLGFSESEKRQIVPSVFKPELGRVLMEQGTNVVIIAGILMVFIVFIAFRSIIPSIAVIQAAVFDILIALGILPIIGFEMNLAGVAALLMLIGYSVDTDIMLTSRILKRGDKEFSEKANDAFSTGITMTGTTLAVMTAVFLISTFVGMDTIVQISTVLLVGLVADLMTTWFTNIAILKWYSEKPRSQSNRFSFSIFRS